VTEDPLGLSGPEHPLDAYSSAVTNVVERLSPSVANLRVFKAIRGGRRVEGGGSGVVLTPDGFIITSAHVVARSDGVVASLLDGRELELDLIGADALSDLAVLRAQASDLVPARLGDASRLRVGQLVVALGNPLGFGGSVTAGVVSALGRSFATRAGAVTRFVENVIQTDAALHPGNSGGALADTSAEVVGINTALVGPAVGQGLGLAVPVNEATRKIIASLMTEGKVVRAFLGVAGGPRPLAPRVTQATGRSHGIEVVEVVAGGPAEHAGVKPEDILLSLEGHELKGMDDVQRLMDAAAVGKVLTLSVFRSGAIVELSVEPVELTAT
jgi:S1-C subfamily serine protease